MLSKLVQLLFVKVAGLRESGKKIKKKERRTKEEIQN